MAQLFFSNGTLCSILYIGTCKHYSNETVFLLSKKKSLVEEKRNYRIEYRVICKNRKSENLPRFFLFNEFRVTTLPAG